ncbi:MAG: hypothetical protein KDK26_15860 [Roseivivax sp.]|nr:hypothetical protein [Roseivivax sp.]
MAWIVSIAVFLAHALAIQRPARRRHWEIVIALALFWLGTLGVSLWQASAFPLLGMLVAAPALAGLAAGTVTARMRRRTRRTI